MQSRVEPGGARRVLASSAGTWSQEVERRSHEKPGRAKMGQDGPKRSGEARQSQGSHGEFWRVLLGLGARGWAGGATRSQEGTK